jgi:uncharacterized delta-60 repeat protein
VLVVGTADQRLLLIRYRRDGALDRSFGRKGIATFDFGRYFIAHDTVLDGEGRLLVVGATGAWDTPSRDAAVLRFDAAGHLDPTLDEDGIALVDYGGPKGNYPVAIKLLRTGAFDPMFVDFSGQAGWHQAGGGDEGLADLAFDRTTNRIVVSASGSTPDYSRTGLLLNTFDLTTGSFREGEVIKVDRRLTSPGPLAIDSSGRTIVTGWVTFDKPSKYGWHYGQTNFAYMIVARANANGKLERCFGRGGFARIWFRGRFSKPAAVAVTGGGKIIIAGPVYTGEKDAPPRFQVARLHGGGC